MITRRNFLRLCTAAGVMAGPLASLLGAQKPGSNRPNILLMMADDLGYECIGANGGTSYKTPNLNRLAAEGMRFEHCYAQPLCTPSRVQIMTGIYNVRDYIDFGSLPSDATPFSQLFKEAGYATSIAGKWQLGMDRTMIRQLGFDEYCLWSLEADEKTPRYRGPTGFIQNGKELPADKNLYGPDVVSDFLLDFITRNKTRPFLCYYPMLLPHAPFSPTPDSPMRQNGSERGGVFTRVKNIFGGKEPKKTQYFPDMVAYMDKIVGKLAAHLEKLGLRDNTLTLFTGDNGTSQNIHSMLGNKEVIGAKGSTTDAGTRVPLIATWPKVAPKGKVSSDLVDFTDFLPTLCAAAAIPVPRELAIDGRSFLPQLRGDKGRPREWIYCWYSKGGGSAKAVDFARNQRYKLYRNGQFYDVSTDSLEKHNLPQTSLDEHAKKTRAMLQSVLDKYRDARPEKLRTA